MYARVSSEAQRERHTIASQLSTLPNYCQAQGWQVTATYTDDGRTAKAGHLAARDGFARLMLDATARKFDVVAVVDLDRLTRSEDLGERGKILGDFQRLGIKIAVASTGQILDLATSGGDLFATLGAFFAAEENRKRRDRAKRGRERAAKEGRPPTLPPWGYRYVGAWQVTEHADVVREIFRRVVDGESLNKICQSLNAGGVASPRGRRWARGNLRPIVIQSAYRGEWQTDGAVIRVPPLVSPDDWYAAQERMAANKCAGLGRTKYPYLIAGLAVCNCGTRMRVHSIQPRYRYYECDARWTRDDGSIGCRSRAWRVEEADARVWAALVDWIERTDLAALLSAADPDGSAWQGDLDEARRRIERLDSAESGVVRRMSAGTISERVGDRELERIGAERRLLERQAATARAALGVQGNRREAVTRALERLQTLRKALPLIVTPEERREIARALLQSRDAVQFVDGEIHVRALLLDDALRTEVRLSA